MTIHRRDILKVVGSSVAGAVASPLITKRAEAGSRTIHRDVCVIGGGSAGCYTAVRLQDLGRSVAVVERQNRLGGHAETYVDPASGAAINYGVFIYEGTELVKNYTQRFNLPLIKPDFPAAPTTYVDFRTGKVVTGYAPPDFTAFATALVTYRTILAQLYPYLDDGFVLPDPVPLELARPFSEFVVKYNLQALFPLAFQYAQGLGDMLGNPAIYALKNFSAAVVDGILTGNFLLAPGGYATLYNNISTHLGENALLNTEVVEVEQLRRNRFRVKTKSDCSEVDIVCNKLVIACPPTPRALSCFGVESQTRELFRRMRSTHYSTAVAQLSGLPDYMSVQNVGADTLYNLPVLPGAYSISPSPAPGLYNIKAGGFTPIDDRAAQRLMVSAVERIARAGTFPVRFEGFRVFANHAPFELHVGGEEISSGYYAKINALQGRNNTYFTGAAVQTHDSSLIWRFCESQLPSVAS